jgi:streptogramin lyase
VDVSWEPLIDGQYFYMQLQTRYVAHLKQMRGTIESIQFPVDSVRTGRRAGSAMMRGHL